jgi:uncharacterized paraquat-inducible protein A
MLLGKLAVREGVCTQEQVDECLQMQSIGGSEAPLGDLLLFKGYLTAHRLKELLSRQQKKVMTCPACRISFTVVSLTGGNSARCPRCKGPLEEPGSDAPLRADAEFSTRKVPTTRSSGPNESYACVICDRAFQAARDASGRVRCPSCGSSFSPK